MQRGPEQLNIDSGQNEKERPKIYENNQCQYCGNEFENPHSCRVCASNKQKRTFLASQKKSK